jgi:hypothetical protein
VTTRERTSLQSISIRDLASGMPKRRIATQTAKSKCKQFLLLEDSSLDASCCPDLSDRSVTDVRQWRVLVATVVASHGARTISFSESDSQRNHFFENLRGG